MCPSSTKLYTLGTKHCLFFVSSVHLIAWHMKCIQQLNMLNWDELWVQEETEMDKRPTVLLVYFVRVKLIQFYLFTLSEQTEDERY